MTQEENQLLLKDLCSRLPYGVSVKIFDESILMEESNNEKGTLYGKESMSDDCFVIKCKNDSWIISCEDFKPYLRPMSSMTRKEFDEYMRFIKHSWEGIDKEEDDYYVKVKDRDVYIDWLNAHHFDYRGLIEKGLALEAKEGMYKTE